MMTMMRNFLEDSTIYTRSNLLLFWLDYFSGPFSWLRYAVLVVKAVKVILPLLRVILLG